MEVLQAELASLAFTALSASLLAASGVAWQSWRRYARRAHLPLHDAFVRDNHAYEQDASGPQEPERLVLVHEERSEPGDDAEEAGPGPGAPGADGPWGGLDLAGYTRIYTVYTALSRMSSRRASETSPGDACAPAAAAGAGRGAGYAGPSTRASLEGLGHGPALPLRTSLSGSVSRSGSGSGYGAAQGLLGAFASARWPGGVGSSGGGGGSGGGSLRSSLEPLLPRRPRLRRCSQALASAGGAGAGAGPAACSSGGGGPGPSPASAAVAAGGTGVLPSSSGAWGPEGAPGLGSQRAKPARLGGGVGAGGGLLDRAEDLGLLDRAEARGGLGRASTGPPGPSGGTAWSDGGLQAMSGGVAGQGSGLQLERLVTALSERGSLGGAGPWQESEEAGRVEAKAAAAWLADGCRAVGEGCGVGDGDGVCQVVRGLERVPPSKAGAGGELRLGVREIALA